MSDHARCLRLRNLPQVSGLQAACCRGIPAAMKRFLRIYSGLFLAFAVALTAHGAAARQGARDAAGQMVICTSMGAKVVYVDSDGQPVAPPHVCPDCVMHLLDAVASTAGLPVPRQMVSSAWHGLNRSGSGSYVQPNATARAPPAL